MERLGLQFQRTRKNRWIGSVMALICLLAAIDDFFWDGDHVKGMAALTWGLGSLLLAYDGYLVKHDDGRATSIPIRLGGALLMIAFLVWALA